MRHMIVIAAVLVAAGCTKAADKATAKLEPRSGSQVTGTVTFQEQAGSVEITVEAKGMPPGKHAINVHEKGDCSGSNAAAVGARFSPGGDTKAGALGEIAVGPDGNGTLKVASSKFTVAAGDRSLVGRSIVISGDPQNLASTTTFGIIACGVIELPQ